MEFWFMESRKFGNAEKIIWCPPKSQIAKNDGINNNKFAKKFMRAATKVLPIKILTCPLNGKMELVNFDISFDVMKMLPKGRYYLKFNIYDVKTTVILSIDLKIKQT